MVLDIFISLYIYLATTAHQRLDDDANDDDLNDHLNARAFYDDDVPPRVCRKKRSATTTNFVGWDEVDE